jgi:hypothetical protein
MAYPFESLEGWLALEYTGHIHQIAEQLPDPERFNLSEQMKRAANSIILNIAEGQQALTTKSKPGFWKLLLVRSSKRSMPCTLFTGETTWMIAIISVRPTSSVKRSSRSPNHSGLRWRTIQPLCGTNASATTKARRSEKAVHWTVACGRLPAISRRRR